MERKRWQKIRGIKRERKRNREREREKEREREREREGDWTRGDGENRLLSLRTGARTGNRNP